MASSGTIDRTKIKLSSFLDKSFLRAGIQHQLITSEKIESAVSDLEVMLKNYSTKGVQLWCEERITITPVIGALKTSLPEGTADIDILSIRSQNILSPTYIRDVVSGTDITALMGGAGYQQLVGSSILISLASAIPSGDYDLLFGFNQATNITASYETSKDAVTFSAVTNLGDPTKAYAMSFALRQITSFPITVPEGTAFIRINFGNLPAATPIAPPYTIVGSAPLPILSIYDVKIVNGGSEYPLTSIGQDEYHNNGNPFTGGQPHSYYVDRGVDNASIMFFPVFSPLTAKNTDIVMWRKRFIQDVVRVSGTLDVPTRWTEAFIWHLAWRICQQEQNPTKDWKEIKAVADEMEHLTRETERVKGKIKFRFGS